MALSHRLFSAALAMAIWVAVPGLAVAVDPPEKKPIGGVEVTFQTDDGMDLHGNLFKPAGGEVKGGIVFVHQPFRTRRDWSYMAEKMSSDGFFTLVFDLRGHGDSLMQGDEELDRELFGSEEYLAMTADVAGAVDLVRSQPGVDPGAVQLVGADLGASVALLYALDDEQISSVAMLSPGLGYDDVNIVGKAAELGARPLCLVYSVEDGYARKSTEVMAKEAKGPLHTQQYYGVGHGAQMLAREPALEDMLRGWFLGTLIDKGPVGLADTGTIEGTEKGVREGEVDQSQKDALREQKDQQVEGKAVGDDSEKGKRIGD